MASIDSKSDSKVLEQQQNINSRQSNVLKVEYRQVVGGNGLDKPTFGQRFKLALAKVGNFFGGLAGKVLSFFPGLGTVGSAVAYGVQSLSQSAMNSIYQKRGAEASADAQAASFNAANFYTPGFGGIENKSAEDNIQVAPFARGYEKEIAGVVENKGAAASESIQVGI